MWQLIVFALSLALGTWLVEEELGRTDSPSKRSVRRIYQEFMGKPDLERRQYNLFRWPQAMQSEDLPWEATRPLLDLLRYLNDQGLERPTIHLAKWYHRVCLATPDDYRSTDMSELIARRLHLAGYLAAGKLHRLILGYLTRRLSGNG